jgi:hypothetical protein
VAPPPKTVKSKALEEEAMVKIGLVWEVLPCRLKVVPEALLKKTVVTDKPEVEALVRLKLPEEEALRMKALETDKPEEEALVRLKLPEEEALVMKALREVKPVVEALPNWLETNRLPEAVDWTMPAVREDKVVEATTVKVPPMVVVAAVRPEVEALVKLTWPKVARPETVRPEVEALVK